MRTIIIVASYYNQIPFRQRKTVFPQLMQCLLLEAQTCVMRAFQMFTFFLKVSFWFCFLFITFLAFSLLLFIHAVATQTWLISDMLLFYINIKLAAMPILMWTLNKNKQYSDESKGCLTAQWASRFSLVMQVNNCRGLVRLHSIFFFGEMRRKKKGLPMGETFFCGFRSRRRWQNNRWCSVCFTTAFLLPFVPVDAKGGAAAVAWDHSQDAQV